MVTATITRSQYDSRVQRIVLPDAIYATRSTIGDGCWKKGEERDPADTQWWMSSQNPNILERSRLVARFDTAIAPNALLSDEEFLTDALTKRIYVVQGLEFGIRGDPMGCHNMSKCCEKLDWLFRWKWSERLQLFSFATKMQFESLWDSLRSGPLSLVSIASRVKEYLAGCATGQESMWHIDLEGHATVFWKKFALELGVTSSSLRDPEFRVDLLDQMATVLPTASEALACVSAWNIDPTGGVIGVQF